MTDTADAAPGRAAQPKPPLPLLLLPAFVVVIAAWAPLQLLGLGLAPFHTKGEPREAVVVADILQRGEWILPRRNAVELPAKPPLFHWLAAVTSLGLGQLSELAVRLPSALQSLGAALLLLVAGTRLYGTRCGLVASLILLTSFEWLRAATSARVDMTLAFGLTSSFIGLLLLRNDERRIWRFLVYLGFVWAVLAKGPVGIALPLLHLVLVCFIDRSTELLRRLRPIRGLIVVGILAGAWYGLATARGGYDFFAKQILDENVYRFLGSTGLTGGHRHSVLYLAAMLVVGFLPWSLFLFGIVGESKNAKTPFDELRASGTGTLEATVQPLRLSSSKPRFGEHNPRAFIISWAILIFAFYAIPASKRGVYLLPMYPALSLLVAVRLESLLRGEVRPRLQRSLLMVAGGLLLAVSSVAALVAAGHAASIPVIPSVAGLLPGGGGTDMQRAALVVGAQGRSLAIYFAVALVPSLALLLAARGRRWGLAFAALVLSVGVLTLSVRLAILPEIAKQRTRRNFVEEVRATLPDSSTLSAYRGFDYGMVYYWGKAIPVENARLSSKGPPYVVMSESQWGRLRSGERQFYERVPGLESDRGGNLGRLIIAQRIAPPQ